LANVRGLRGLKSVVRDKFVGLLFCRVCVEGLIASEVILGQEIYVVMFGSFGDCGRKRRCRFSIIFKYW